MNDLRIALRVLRRQPGFTLVAVATLALGIGLNSAIFSVVNGVVLRPLAYRDADRLTMVWETNEGLGLSEATTSFPNFLDWREHRGVFEDLGVFQYMPYDLTGYETPERVWGARVTENLFPLLGVEPFLGRQLSADDGREGNEPAALISHAFWQQRAGGDPEILGKTVRLDGQPHTIVGVMPSGFEFPPPLRFGGRFVSLPMEVWLPIVPGPPERNRDFRLYFAVGRLAAGVGREQAQAEMVTVSQHLAEAHPDVNAGWGVSVVPLREQVVGHVRPAMLVLMGTVLAVLLLACANLANLLLARSSSREQELAVRQALGAPRSRLTRQLLTESFLLAVAGGAVGLLLTHWALRLLTSLSPGNIPRLQEVSVDTTVLGFTLFVTVLTALLFGLAPSLRLPASASMSPVLAGGRSGGTDKGLRRLRGGLIVVEVALALALLIGVGLLLKSFSRLTAADTGFDARNVVTAELLLSEANYPNAHRIAQFQSALLERLKALPGVEAVGLVNMLPLTEHNMKINFTIENRPALRASDRPLAEYRVISPGYLGAMGIEVVEGRGFDAGDDAEAPRVALVNRTLAELYWPGRSPLGERLLMGEQAALVRGRQPDPQEFAYRIVGVIEDVTHFGPGSQVPPELYVPHLQDPWPLFFPVVRTATSATGFADAVRSEIRRLDRQQAIAGIRSMEERLAGVTAQPRFTLVLLAAFSLLAMALAVIGTYGVVAYLVALRTHEFGIRMALGATRKRLFGSVLGEILALVLVGVALGLGAAFGLTRFLGNLLYEVSATDSPTFVGAILLIVLAASIAAFVPALKAARLNPGAVLRSL